MPLAMTQVFTVGRKNPPPSSIRAFAYSSSAGDFEAAIETAALTIVVACMKIQRTNATTRMEMETKEEGAMFVRVYD